jgi:CheY-like chemotaxis protein
MNLECICPQGHACGDMLITDNRMPGMTGLEFVEHQSRRGCKGIVGNKLVVSGSWTPAEIATAEQLGCKVLHKPYNISQLVSWVEERTNSIQPGRKLTRLEDFS